MVLWHSLVPLAQLLENVGVLAQRYLQKLHDIWECDYEEMWMDPTRGVVCRGPKGPHSSIGWGELKVKDLPPTAELLQEEVLVRFLASHKSKEADDALMDAMYYAWNDEYVDGPVNRPTVFSTRTKTPIAVADNAWGSEYSNLVDRTCLKNGWTRFQLDSDGWLCLRSNWDVERAWLWQLWSVFHARGVSLEDDVEGFKLVFPRVWLYGDLDESPSKRQQQRQQAIYLFVSPPPLNLFDGKTSPLHHWSFQKDGQPQLSPKLCFGLPVQLDLNHHARSIAHFSHSSITSSWSTNSYKLIHQYQTLRGFDPTTTDFARHLGYCHVFQPQNDDDRFEDVCQGQTSACLEGFTDLNRSVVSSDPEYRSTVQGPEENSSFGTGINTNDSSPGCTAESSPNAVSGQHWMADTRYRLGVAGTQGYLDQAFRCNSDEYRRGSSYSGVEMLDTSDHLSSRISQHTTVTSSNGYEFHPTVQPTMVPSTLPGDLEEVVDDCDSPLTSADDPNVKELCALFERLTIA
ncbi:hypothetical protein PM082_014836 [Marasmius tenuissimus]|nr:hypothetical protein PM082_014836 [Marasmius tenuissimus]